MSEVVLVRTPDSPVVVIQPKTEVLTAPNNMDAAVTATQAALEANLARNGSQESAAEAEASRVAAEAAKVAAEAARDTASNWKDDAAASAAAALSSKNAAAANQTAASNSSASASASATSAATQAGLSAAARVGSEAARDAASSSKDAAAASATAAAASAAGAAASATTATAAEADALASKTAAQTSKDQAASSASAAASSASAASGSATAAASSASTASDKADATAADRVATGNDRTAAAASATSAAASKDAAALSASAAASSATGADASKTASEAARDASIAAKTASETARDAAVVARTGAETARTGAEAAQTAAQTARTGAETARDAAAASATAAATSQTAAASSATAAAGSASAASADRVLAQTARSGAEAARDAASASAQTATTKAGEALSSANNAAASAAASEASKNAAATSASNIETSYGALGNILDKSAEATAAATVAVSSAQSANLSQLSAAQSALVAAQYSVASGLDTATRNAQAAASLAQGYAASASSVVQQDLSGITAQALHRSPNAITAMAIYDTSKDSDGGAWTEKCQHTSWWNEALSGKWLGAHDNEAQARVLGGATLGAELITNGSVSLDTTGWSASNATLQSVDGKLRVTGTGSVYPSAWQSFTTVVGRAYRVSFTQRTKSGGSFAVNKTDNTNSVGTNRVLLQSNSSNIQVVGYFIATAATTYIHFGLDSLSPFTGFWAEYDDISVREVQASNAAPGDYFQLTTDGKFYRLWKNLLSRSAELDHAYWSKVALSVSANAATAPDGSQTAEIFTFAGSGSPSDVDFRVSFNIPVAGQYTLSLYVRDCTASFFVFRVTGAGANGPFFNLTGAGSVSSLGSAASASVSKVDANWYRLTATYNLGAGSTQIIYGISSSTSSTTSNTVAASFGAWGAQLELGSSATAYEPKAAEGTISEVFRGNKADFPRLAAIVAETNNLTIYDLTEPGRPMWMRFLGTSGFLAWLTAPSVSGVAALSGCVVPVASSGMGGLVLNFPKDDAAIIWNGGYVLRNRQIVSRNSQASFSAEPGGFIVASTTINAVAMTVLPDAPIDPATNLRIPTIAVATNIGISIIKHDGTVVSNTGSSGISSVAINKDLVIGTSYTSSWYQTAPGSLPNNYTINTTALGQNSAPDYYRSIWHVGNKLMGRTKVVSGGMYAPVVSSIVLSTASRLRSITCIATNTHNTGWLPGDIRRVYLSDTEVGTITGPELLTNGGFDTDTSGWTISAYTTSVSGGVLSGTATSAAYPKVYQAISTVAGKRYRLTCSGSATHTSGSATILFASVGATDAPVASVNLASTDAFVSLLFTGTGATMHVGVQNQSNPSTSSWSVDYISLVEVIADRSYKAAAANITGTLTKAALATGTSLVGYSGFSASNYLREPYSADLDFGTGEWSCSAWLNTTFAVAGNLTLNSNTFSSWNGGNGFTRQTDLITAPDGNQYANKFLCTNTATAEDAGVMYRAGANPAGTSVSFFVQDIGVGKRIYFYDNSSPNSFTSYFSFSSKTFTNSGQAIVTSYDELPNNWYRLKYYLPQGNSNYLKIKYEGLAVGDALHLFGHQVERTSAPTSYKPSGASQLVLTAPIADRSFSSGPSLTLGVNSEGKLAATAFDGTTTRLVTTTAAYNTATWLKAEACYTSDGTLSIRVNGREVATSRGNPLLTLNSRYNLLSYSQQFGDSTWAIIAGFSSKVSTAVLDPLGGTTACEIGYLNANGSLSKQSINASMVSGQQYTFSIWARRDSGSNQLNFGSNTGIVLGNFTPTSTWQRYSVTFTYNGTWAHIMLADPNASGWTNVQYWGAQLETGATARTYQRTTTVAETEVAPLTIGNNFALNAPFPGSIALLKLGATVPTYEQSQFMYEQEKQLFRAGAQSVLPDSGSIVDMAYDDATDRWVAISATNESYWTGLVRNSVTPVPAGSYSRIVAGSGVELAARSTTNPGVDVTIPAYGLREELVKRAEAAARLTKEIVTYDYVGGFTANTTTGNTAITNVSTITYPASYIGARISGSGIPANTTIVAVSGTTIYLSAAATATATGVSISFLDFELPVGMEAKTVLSAGALRREGSTQDYTRLYDGFIETIRFAVAPGATAWVQIQAQRITLQ